MDSPKPPSIIQTLLDAFWSLRRAFLVWQIYLSFRLYGLEVSRLDVRRESYDLLKHENLSLDNVDPDGFLEITKSIYAEAKERIAGVSEKCQTLLRVGSLVLAAFGILLPKYLAFDALWMRILFLVSALLLLNSIILLLAFYAVRKATVLDVAQPEAGLSAVDLKKCLINNYRYVTVSLDNRNNYLVDVYTVARFSFLSSFSIFVILFSWTFLFSKPHDESQNLIKALRGEISFIKGVQGEKGERGAPAKVDEDALIEKLVNDKRIEHAMTKVLEGAEKERAKAQKEIQK